MYLCLSFIIDIGKYRDKKRPWDLLTRVFLESAKRGRDNIPLTRAFCFVAFNEKMKFFRRVSVVLPVTLSSIMNWCTDAGAKKIRSKKIQRSIDDRSMKQKRNSKSLSGWCESGPDLAQPNQFQQIKIHIQRIFQSLMMLYTKNLSATIAPVCCLSVRAVPGKRCGFLSIFCGLVDYFQALSSIFGANL